MPAAPLDISLHENAPLGQLLRRVLAGACLGGLIVVTAVLATRRIGGMFALPLSAATLFCAGTLIASLTLIAQWPHRLALRDALRDGNTRVQAIDVLALGLPAFVAALLAASMTLPETSPGGLILLWLPLVAAESVFVWLHRRQPSIAAPNEAASTTFLPDATQDLRTNTIVELDESLENEATSAEVSDDDCEELSDEELAADVTQTWTRRTIDGADLLEGMARVQFKDGLRVTNLHVGVCPPFATLPEVFAEATEGAAAEVKVAEALSFGLRIEVRLTEASSGDKSDGDSVVVAVVARAGGALADVSP